MTMKALKYNEVTKELHLDTNAPIPTAAPNEALIQISRAGVCSTDLHILNGYVPGFNHTMGHEFIGIVTECPANPDLVGKRCVGEINCRCQPFNHTDPIMVRNHAPNRIVLGIIAKDGCMAEYCTLPVENLHLVPDDITDKEACFAEPLAAACRIIEQQAITTKDQAIAVVGDGKLGLLVAQMLVVSGHNKVILFGRHERKMQLVQGVERRVIMNKEKPVADEFVGGFDVAIEASGSPAGIQQTLQLTRCLGTIVLKSTCAINDPNMPCWSAVANDVVVNEKVLIGSRCGPYPPALEALKDERMKRLVDAMVEGEFGLSQGVEAMKKAGEKGVLKVQLVMT